MTWEHHQRQADALLLNAMHPGTVVPDPDADLELSDGPTDWDGGAREQPPPQPPRIEWSRDPHDPAWVTVEIEDRADWLWPGLGR